MENVLCNPGILGLHKLPGRSPVIPAQRKGVTYGNKEDSAFLQDLNGTYRFRYLTEDPGDVFYAEDYDDSSWDSIDVPSMWQYRGYGSCAYTNISYPFPFDPPYIDCENPVGFYRRVFSVERRTERTILHFAGVDNAFFVWVNGTFAGFSKGSRNPAEFDVSALIREGKNLLAVKVMTYSDASYLEAQDMLLANGIFRDVYLLHTGAFSLWDYRVRSDLKSFTVTIDSMETDYANKAIRVELGDYVGTFPAEQKLCVRIPVENPRLWNAEEPNLYDLTITLLENGEPREIHSKRVGMMHTEIRDWKFLVNGSPVFIKGINRHETSCDNGRAISRAAILEEVQRIKANQLNAVRTSHYPNDPYFYEVCSQIGLYVMDEADLEAHGCGETGDQGYLSKRPEWREAYLDRVRRMLELDKNEPCVFIHSMGNECGAGENLLAGQRMAAEFDPDHVAIHDMEVNREKLRSGRLEAGDNLLRMGYLSRAELEEYDRAMPIYMQIEYGHAMGNSPGYLMGYQQWLYDHPKCIGGFLWEFKSHALRRINPDGSSDFLYGTDLGPKGHWSNFCLDGYMRADGTPKYTWNEVFEAFAPVWVTGSGNEYRIRNTYDFRSLEGVVCRGELCEDTKPIESFSLPLPPLAPHETALLPVPTEIRSPVPGAAYFINLHFFRDGKNIGNDQRALGVRRAPAAYVPPAGVLSLSCEGERVTVENESFRLVLRGGLPAEYSVGGKALLDSPMRFNFLRAPIDNDGITDMLGWMERDVRIWREALLETIRFAPHDIKAERLGDRVRVTAIGRVLPASRFYGLDAVIVNDVFADGLVLFSVSAKPYGNWPEHLPRIGLTFSADGGFDSLRWYGRGPRENYPDCTAAAPVGLYACKVAESYTVFDRPQDSGNHEETALLQLMDGAGTNLTVVGCPRFSFEAHDFPLESLIAAAHPSELKKDGKTHLYIDYRMRGLGSHSCGPLPEAEYELGIHEFTFAFAFGGNLDAAKALALHRSDFGVRTGTGSAYENALEGKEKFRLL